jgi:hypothetical protein
MHFTQTQTTMGLDSIWTFHHFRATGAEAGILLQEKAVATL